MWLRLIGGFAVLGAGVGAVVTAWWALFVWISLTPPLAALVVAMISPVAAWPLAGFLALAGLAGAGAAVAVAAGPSSCEQFEFSRSAWKRGRVRSARLLYSPR